MKPRKHDRINHADGSCTVHGFTFNSRKVAKKSVHRSRSKERISNWRRWRRAKSFYQELNAVLEYVWDKYHAKQQLNDTNQAETGN